MSEMVHVGNMPILALRGLVIFPEQTIHFEVGRKKSVLALEEAMKGDQTLLLIPQKDIAEDDPDLDGLHAMGTVAQVKQVSMPLWTPQEVWSLARYVSLTNSYRKTKLFHLFALF